MYILETGYYDSSSYWLTAIVGDFFSRSGVGGARDSEGGFIHTRRTFLLNLTQGGSYLCSGVTLMQYVFSIRPLSRKVVSRRAFKEGFYSRRGHYSRIYVWCILRAVIG